MAIGCPYGGDHQQGLVFIHNGHAGGLKNRPTQVLSGQWASSSFPASFGFALRGNMDIDQNGYPDLIVGAFGLDKAVLYRYNYPLCIFTLDSAKQNQKESVRRALFLESQQPTLVKTLNLTNGERFCCETKIYLRAEEEFRDKLSPIDISLNFSLGPQVAPDQHDLSPILNYQTEQRVEQKVGSLSTGSSPL
ncbi:hypothetical protein GOODEAATRI_007522 [Goodea atripinnis]|uniref:Integrin alpha first immunoglubulin-like domain-containing protein n=1 Tax=Goodea atripinnis TaxID=208336 RepID=A0ABV0NSP3_9TELE